VSTSLNLTRPQKAAAILVAMGKQSASRLLKFFKQEELRALVESARLLRTIPQSELEKIVAEFEQEFAEGAGLLDSGDTMETIMNESLSPEEMNAVMGVETVEMGIPEEPPEPVWPKVEKLEAPRLGAFLAGEHPQIVAVVLSKLAPQAAASVLVTLDKATRGEVIKRMMSTTNVPDAALKIVEDQIRERLLVENVSKDSSAGQMRVANVLNELDKGQLEEVMSDLEASGSTDVQAIRSKLFTFDDIPLLTQKARVTLFDGISTETVTLALRKADPALVEAVLSSIGARTRRMIESELVAGPDSVKDEDISKARKQIASTAIKRASEGAFQLPSAEQPQGAAA
jgi:flagellar motor switch protein FliG